MAESDTRIRINRAPVLTLWAAVVAERLGFDRDTALTLGQVVTGVSAQTDHSCRSFQLSHESYCAAFEPHNCVQGEVSTRFSPRWASPADCHRRHLAPCDQTKNRLSPTL
jgi:hypothetical protein